MGRTKERHRRLRVTQKERRSGQRFYSDMRLKRESIDGGAYDVEVETRAGRERPNTNTEAQEITREGTHTVIQSDSFFDGPDDLRYILRYLEL